MKKKYIRKPWQLVYYNIYSRCNNPKNERYYRYGGRGIKCLITVEEIKELWFRDKAWLLKKPSIDREDNDGHYEFNNCKFIEHFENTSKAFRKQILQYDLKGNLIKEWKSVLEAAKALNIDNSHICKVARNERRKAGGFGWKYPSLTLNP